MARQHLYWKRNGPPPNIAILNIAASLGVKLISDEPDARSPGGVTAPTEMPEDPAFNALIADIEMPGPGVDTRAASRAIIEKLKAGLP